MSDDTAPRGIDYLPDDPCRPPDWRWRRAGQLILREDRRRTWDDAWVVRATLFRKTLGLAGGDAGHPRLARLDAPVFEASQLWRGDARRRWEIEARILAGQSDDEIAGRLGLATEVIESYEALFFRVRDRLEASDWVAFQVIGGRLHEGSEVGDVESLWKSFAFYGGPLVLEALLESFPRNSKDDEGPAVEPRLAPLLDLAFKVSALYVTPRNAVALIRLDALARRLDQVEVAQRVAPVMRPIVVGPIEVTIKPGLVEIACASARQRPRKWRRLGPIAINPRSRGSARRADLAAILAYFASDPIGRTRGPCYAQARVAGLFKRLHIGENPAMSWEFRKGRRVYYSAVKRNGRVVKTYIGAGVVGEIGAGLAAEARRKRTEQAAALDADQAQLAGPDRAIAALDRACALAIEASLTAAGFHRFDSKWRRRHVRRTNPHADGSGHRG